MKAAKKSRIPSFGLRHLGVFFAIALLLGIAAVVFLRPTCANSISCVADLTTRVENGSDGVFEGQKILAPEIDLSAVDVDQKVLGEASTQGEKHIYVDLAKQTLYAYQGDKLYMQALVSTGKWGKTPTGDFRIWIKLRATRMSGGEGADYYNLPNVPYVMFFSNSVVPASAGFSLHGAYWHNNFGHTMSHGCVNMRIVDAQKLYEWASPTNIGNTTRASASDPGTLVTIYGQAPN